MVSSQESLPVVRPTGPSVAETMLTPLGRLIFLDRYSRKDQDRTHLRAGLLVVVCVDLTTKQRLVGTIKEVRSTTVLVQLGNEDPIEVPTEQVDIPMETITQAHWRVARAVAKAEGAKADFWAQEFYQILQDFSFVPAGRIWAGAGVEERLTSGNCYVIPAPKDSRSGIIKTLDQMTEIMSRGGGVGIPVMSLRPRFGVVRGVNGRSSGSVAWSEIYGFATGLIEQGGSRQGALMLMQYCWHPDILEFIAAKKDQKRLTKANISVAITDDLMQAIDTDSDWDFVFPDTHHPQYDAEWAGDLPAWLSKGYPVIVHRTMKARELWRQIVECAHASGEPGLFFVDRYNSQSNTNYYAGGQIYCCNPCGEQGIPPYAVCNLGHLNLARFLTGDGTYEAAEVDWDKLGLAIKTAMRFMDNVIDVSNYPLPENEVQQKGERRVGLGTMGLAEVMIRCHIRYGNNPDCLRFLDRLYSFIAWNAYGASADLAEEKGAFPRYDADKLATRPFIRNLPQGLQTSIRKKGLRNSCALTQAPTGTVGTMVGTSTGIEPFFLFEWLRNSRLGIHREYALVYEEYLEAHPDLDEKRAGIAEEDRGSSSDYLPSWFVTAAEMSPEDHAYTQATIQKWVDSSISKTSNVPNDYTADQIGSYYRLLYLLGCKGGTVYRDGSREEQVLNSLGKKKGPEALPRQELRPVPTGVYDAKCAAS